MSYNTVTWDIAEICVLLLRVCFCHNPSNQFCMHSSGLIISLSYQVLYLVVKINWNIIWYVQVHCVVAILLMTSGRNTLRYNIVKPAKWWRCMIKQKALQLEPVLGSYEACKVSYTFPVEKPFNFITPQ